MDFWVSIGECDRPRSSAGVVLMASIVEGVRRRLSWVLFLCDKALRGFFWCGEFMRAHVQRGLY